MEGAVVVVCDRGWVGREEGGDFESLWKGKCKIAFHPHPCWLL